MTLQQSSVAGCLMSLLLLLHSLIVHQLKVRELHVKFVRLHSATQAKHYSSLQPGGGAGPPPPRPSGHVDVFKTALGYKCSWNLSRGRSFISFLCVYLYVCVIFNCVDGTAGVFSILCVSIKVAMCRLYCRNPPCPHGSKMKLFIECRD